MIEIGRPGPGRARTVLAVLLVLVSALPARAGAPSDQLRESVDQVIRILRDPALRVEARDGDLRAALRTEAERIIDFDETARRALGRHWQRLGEEQRRDFVLAFAGLLERAYLTRIEQYSGERVTVLGESIDGDQATVRTRFVTKRGVEIPADYRMRRRDDRWMVYDVVVEGVSLVGNYRTQFNRIMDTGSFEELIRRMKGVGGVIPAPGAPAGSPRS